MVTTQQVLSNFAVALAVSIFLVFLFSVLPDGNPSEAASIILQAFWLIVTTFKILFSVGIVLIGGFIFILLSWFIELINILIHDVFGFEKISSTFILDWQEAGLDAVEALYQGYISFLQGFVQTVEQTMDVDIIWNPEQTFGGGVQIVFESGGNIVGDALQALYDYVSDLVEWLGLGGHEPE